MNKTHLLYCISAAKNGGFNHLASALLEIYRQNFGQVSLSPVKVSSS